MRGHTECNDIVLLRVELEFSRVMALVAIDDQEPIFAFSAKRCMVIKVFNPV
jgi:hypothetical protein